MGENANLTAELVVSYIKGFTHGEFGPQSVTTVTKHFPGSGPVEGGEDSHFTYGKNATYPGVSDSQLVILINSDMTTEQF